MKRFLKSVSAAITQRLCGFTKCVYSYYQCVIVDQCRSVGRLKAVVMAIMLTIVSGKLISQDVDSLLRAATANPDIHMIDQLYEVGNYYEGYEPETAKRIYLKALELSEDLDLPEGYCRFAANFTAVLNMQGQYDSSLAINLNALEAAENANSEIWIAKTKFNIGNCYNIKYLYESALSYYMQVTPYFEKLGNKQFLAQLYDVLQVLYRNMGQYEKAVDYGEKAIALMSDNPEGQVSSHILMNLATNYLKLSPPKRQESLNGLTKALAIARTNQDKALESSTLINLGDYYYKGLQFVEAENYYRSALAVCEQIGNHEGISICLRGFSYCELFKKNYDAAKQYMTQAYEVAYKYDFSDEKRECLASLAELSLMQYDFTRYFEYSIQHDSIATNTQNELILRNTQDLEIKYETEKKVLKIAALQRERNLYGIIFISGLCVLLSFLLLLFLRQRAIKTKNELAEQKIIRLEQEKQLIATQAVLEGETTERSRLARDLHDGLGGLLTSMKLSLNAMKERVFLDVNGRKMFVNALDLLDMSVKELHQVANNMMPESLLNSGLKTAIENFIGNLDAREGCSLSFQFYGAESRFMPDFEMAVYRMAQELYSNALKHAEAGEIFMQMTVDENRLNILYEDDGKGFDLRCLDISKGMGLRNIASRVKAFGGQVEISSAPGQGTQATIEFSDTNKYQIHDTDTDC